MTGVDLEDVQRVVLRAGRARHVAHRLVRLPDAAAGLSLLRALAPRVAFGPALTPEGEARLSLGLTIAGLRALRLPGALLTAMARLSPAFVEGAPARAAARCGDTGPSAVAHWDPAFGFTRCHLVLSLDAADAAALRDACGALVRTIAGHRGEVVGVYEGRALGRPPASAGAGVRAGVPDGPAGDDEVWVHFGYRDGLSRRPVRGFPAGSSSPLRQHEPGEAVLGARNDVEANPGLLPGAVDALREFVLGGSFGTLRIVEQQVGRFEATLGRWAADWVRAHGGAIDDARALLKAKLCGRWPDGRHFAPGRFDRPDDARDPRADFDHGADPDGIGCPFGAHVRRMNPRLPAAGGDAFDADRPAHVRPRLLLRRGLPYGDWGDTDRGLLGWFFGARLEDGLEHLLGAWGDRMPLGVAGDADMKDPLIGQHEPRSGDPVFEIPRPDGAPPWTLRGFAPWCRTRGMAYAFHPSRRALQRIVDVRWEPWPEPAVPLP